MKVWTSTASTTTSLRKRTAAPNAASPRFHPHFPSHVSVHVVVDLSEPDGEDRPELLLCKLVYFSAVVVIARTQKLLCDPGDPHRVLLLRPPAGPDAIFCC